MATRVAPPPPLPTAFDEPKRRGRPRVISRKDHNAGERARRLIQKRTFKRLRDILPAIENKSETKNETLERAICRILELEAILLQTKALEFCVGELRVIVNNHDLEESGCRLEFELPSRGSEAVADLLLAERASQADPPL